MVDFANILLSGRCNLRCPHCVGRLLPQGEGQDNLDRFPLAGLDGFCAALRDAGVTQVALTGTNTDPLLYAHHRRLLAHLRDQVPGARLSLHTNGVLALAKMEIINSYDRVCVSLPSLRATTCKEMTGRARALDLPALVRRCRVPLKLSTLVTRANVTEVPGIVARCRDLGLRRMVLRKLYLSGDGLASREPWEQIQRWLSRFPRRGTFGGNPVLDADGVELTLWDFERTKLRCLSLFSHGSMGTEYELARAPGSRLQAPDFGLRAPGSGPRGVEMTVAAANNSPAPGAPGVLLRPNPGVDRTTVRSVCAVIGSFDPLHRGHQWMVDKLLTRFEAVVLLVPALHFSKTVCPPRNATLDQRLEMIQQVYLPGPGCRVLCGIANEVLFLRLASELARVFPAAEISFAMGNDTYQLFLDSERYFRKLGLPWGRLQQRQLQRLGEQIVVFGRSETGGSFEPVPRQLRQVSSTRVRGISRRLHEAGAVASRWAADLGDLVPPPVTTCIRQLGLYGNSEFLVPS